VAALLFYPAAKIQISGSENLLPGWLLSELGAVSTAVQTTGAY